MPFPEVKCISGHLPPQVIHLRQGEETSNKSTGHCYYLKESDILQSHLKFRDINMFGISKYAKHRLLNTVIKTSDLQWLVIDNTG